MRCFLSVIKDQQAQVLSYQQSSLLTLFIGWSLCFLGKLSFLAVYLKLLAAFMRVIELFRCNAFHLHSLK
jgi:hypothetical protein